jgi:flavodoxin
MYNPSSFPTSVMFKLHNYVNFKFGGIAMKTLVVYYSRTGNTKVVAEKVASELKAEIEEVIDLKNRKETQKSPIDFELIVVGTPVWNSRPASAIRTYLKKNDFSGKKVAVFCTNEGMGKEKALERIKALIANGNIVGELVVSKTLENKEENERRISEWCNQLHSL